MVSVRQSDLSISKMSFIWNANMMSVMKQLAGVTIGRLLNSVSPNMLILKSTQTQVIYLNYNKLYPLEERSTKKVNAGQCFRRIRFVCKLCGIAPVFTGLRNVRWKFLHQLFNWIFCAGFIVFYTWMSRVSNKEMVAEVSNSALMSVIMENMSTNYYLVLIMLVVISQACYGKLEQIFEMLDEMDNYLERAVVTASSALLSKISYFIIALGFVPQNVINLLAFVHVRNKNLFVELDFWIIFSQFTQITFPYMLLSAIFTVLAVLMKFQKVNQFLR